MGIDVTNESGVLSITLNRPDSLNSFNPALHAALADALLSAEDSSVRAVVISGAGRAFSAGQDLADLEKLNRGVAASLRQTYNSNILAIRALEKP